MQRASGLFKLLADGTRLRLLRVLSQDRFNVSELTGILGVAQSGVSRHLGLLKEAGLVTEEREAGYVYCRLADEGRTNGQDPLWALLDGQFAASAGDRAVREDEARLQEVLRLRKENFETHGDVRQLVPGRSWAAWARALGHLLPPLDVADIGCGDGYLALEMARWARTVVGIDRSDRVLERAEALADRRHVTNAQWRKGDLSRLPLGDASVDVALLSQALHHAADPERSVAEAVRILRPDHPLFNTPNRIAAADWVGWPQERGLYFAGTWDDAYVPLLEMSDAGRPPLQGGLLVARYGAGTYVYTGLSFFRALPAGTPGAFRLFLNLLGLKPDHVQ